MIEKLYPLKFPPGLYKNGTKYQAQGRWYDANGVRFSDGTIRPIGGWRRMKNTTDADIAALLGKPRGMVAFRGNNGVTRAGIGTHTKAYALVDGTVTDITPAGFTTGNADGGYSGGSGNYGAGNYGAGVYGGGALNLTLLEADTWQLDSFGDYLVGCFTADGKLYYWDGNAANDFVQMAGSPTSCRAIVVTPERFVFALGASGDPRKIQWPTQEGGITVAGDWTPSSSNSAGDFPISTTGRIVCGRRTRRQTLIFTDVDVWTATYIGGTLIYSFDQAGDNCGIVSPNAVAIAGTMAFWMGKDGFFAFDGYVKPLPCEVRDHVFRDINFVQRAKIHAQTFSEFNEVWWFYPSASATENDRYVCYNYAENHWSIGVISRATGVDRGAFSTPVLVSQDGFIYEHEVNFTGYEGASALFLESGPMEIAGGDQLVRVQRIVPDELTAGDFGLTFYHSMFPTGTETTLVVAAGSAPQDVRFTARQTRMRVVPTASKDWRVGIFRLAGIPSSRR